MTAARRAMSGVKPPSEYPRASFCWAKLACEEPTRLDSTRWRHSLNLMTSRLLLLLSMLPVLAGAAQTNETLTRTQDVIYGRESGTALTLDVFTPSAPNGIGILWIVSAGIGV